jgi:hypothetical protein
LFYFPGVELLVSACEREGGERARRGFHHGPRRERPSTGISFSLLFSFIFCFFEINNYKNSNSFKFEQILDLNKNLNLKKSSNILNVQNKKCSNIKNVQI